MYLRQNKSGVMHEETLDRYYFDVAAWELLDNEVAAKRLAASDESVRHVGSLLLAAETDFPEKPEDVSELPHGQTWTHDELVQFGHWALRAIDAVEPAETRRHRSQLTREHMVRLRQLDIGPSMSHVRKYFRTMWGYREALGIHAGFAIGKFNGWTRKDYVDYAAQLAQDLGRRPKIEDYDAAHEASNGANPSGQFIYSHVEGGLRAVHDAIGYPDVFNWDEEDFVHWGAQVLEANDGMLNRFVIDALSQQDRGPSSPTIARHFRSLRTFKKRAAEQLARQQREAMERRQSLLTLFAGLRERQILPPDWDDSDEQERSSMAAKYALATVCVPGASTAVRSRIAQADTVMLIPRIRFVSRYDPRLTAGVIELAASTHGLFDEIWPMHGHLEHLRVPDRVLTAGRDEARLMWDRIKQQQASN